MPRQIITQRLAALPHIQGAQEDKWTDKVLKLIPADVVAVYLGVFNLIKSQNGAKDDAQVLQWIVFALVAVITPFYLRNVIGIKDWKQVILCEISFFIWALSIGGPFDGTMWGSFSPQFIGAIILPIYTLVIPIFYKD